MGGKFRGEASCPNIVERSGEPPSSPSNGQDISACSADISAKIDPIGFTEGVGVTGASRPGLLILVGETLFRTVAMISVELPSTRLVLGGRSNVLKAKFRVGIGMYGGVCLGGGSDIEKDGSVGDQFSFIRFDMSSGTCIFHSVDSSFSFTTSPPSIFSGLSSCAEISLESPSGRFRGEEMMNGVPFHESSASSIS
jgi:hypothetical protein